MTKVALHEMLKGLLQAEKKGYYSAIKTQESINCPGRG